MIFLHPYYSIDTYIFNAASCRLKVLELKSHWEAMAMFQAASMKIIVSKFYLFELAISLIVSRQFHTFATASPSEFRQLQKLKFYKKNLQPVEITCTVVLIFEFFTG